MPKTLPTKYLDEDSIKKKLNVESVRNLPKEKIAEFASMLPYTDKEVAIHMINQFPSFADFGKEAIGEYQQLCDKILNSNKGSQIAAIKGYQTILDALAVRLDKPHINRRERKAITEDMISVADKIAELDWENKKFLDKISVRTSATFLGIAALVGAGAGIGFKFFNKG